MNAFASWLIARAKEPSTYAGLAGLIASMSFIPHASDAAALMPVIGTAIASVLAVVIPQAKP